MGFLYFMDFFLISLSLEFWGKNWIRQAEGSPSITLNPTACPTWWEAEQKKSVYAIWESSGQK